MEVRVYVMFVLLAWSIITECNLLVGKSSNALQCFAEVVMSFKRFHILPSCSHKLQGILLWFYMMDDCKLGHIWEVEVNFLFLIIIVIKSLANVGGICTQ